MEGVGLRLPDFASLLLRRCPPSPPAAARFHISHSPGTHGEHRIRQPATLSGRAQLHAVARRLSVRPVSGYEGSAIPWGQGASLQLIAAALISYSLISSVRVHLILAGTRVIAAKRPA